MKGIAIEVGPHFCFFIASGNSIADADHHLQFTQVIIDTAYKDGDYTSLQTSYRF
jgi:hypothetical protein